ISGAPDIGSGLAGDGYLVLGKVGADPEDRSGASLTGDAVARNRALWLTGDLVGRTAARRSFSKRAFSALRAQIGRVSKGVPETTLGAAKTLERQRLIPLRSARSPAPARGPRDIQRRPYGYGTSSAGFVQDREGMPRLAVKYRDETPCRWRSATLPESHGETLTTYD